MTTTPLMNLVLPTDHGSADTWDVILDAAFGLIDAHDHTTLRGAQVPMGGIKVDADKSWSFGGTSRAITDLKAVDFVAVAAATVTSLAGALFLNSADNNLYYRTTAGSNVQLTNGAALNVAAFAGGIGGDYSAVGALEIFDDATDSYWFQQQLGAGVRQYARMRCGDVDLYEYKAAPAAGPIPTNRVRLASPAALAASYALTMPGALPATRSITRVDSTGTLTFQSSQTIKIPIVAPFLTSAGLAQSLQTSAANGRQIQLVGLPIGCRITSIKARIRDSVTGPTTLGMTFFSSTDNVTSATIATSGLSTGAGTFQTLTTPATTTTVVSGTEYWALVFVQSGTATCDIYSLEVTYDTL